MIAESGGKIVEEIEIIEKEIGDVIEIEERVPVWKMPSVMSSDFKKIKDHLKSNGAECKDAPYARYLDIDWDLEMKKGAFANFIRVFTKKWHFQAGMPTSTKIGGENNLISRQISNKKYVKTIHYGPYHKVGITYKKMYAWAKSQNLSFENESLEFYLNGPRDTEKEFLKTVVLIPVVDK
jgi:effector-binding domain-containing protein